MAPASRGALIVLEGLDRAGKSTQHTLLCSHLTSLGHSVKSLRFPDRSTPIGKSIDSYLKGENEVEDHVVHLLFSANRWEAAPSIFSALEAGTHVVIDRYYYSGIVYSAAKGKEGLTLEWCKSPDVGLPKPDLILFLEVDAETARSRGGFGTERYEKEEMQRRVRHLFLRVIEMEEDGREKTTTVISAGRSLEDVQKEIEAIAGDVLKSKKLNEPVGRIHP